MENKDIVEKIQVIDQIVERHPSIGVKKGWSHYVGGMADTGDWYYRRMLGASLEELQGFLDELIADENKPKYQPTEQEIADSKIVHFNKKHKFWYTESSIKMEKWLQDTLDNKMLGLSPPPHPYQKEG